MIFLLVAEEETGMVGVESTMFVPSQTRTFPEVAAPTLIHFPSVPASVRELLTVSAFPEEVMDQLYA